jgi:hypothetical protein
VAHCSKGTGVGVAGGASVGVAVGKGVTVGVGKGVGVGIIVGVTGTPTDRDDLGEGCVRAKKGEAGMKRTDTKLKSRIPIRRQTPKTIVRLL